LNCTYWFIPEKLGDADTVVVVLNEAELEGSSIVLPELVVVLAFEFLEHLKSLRGMSERDTAKGR
jgi:hypothetical protein